MTRINPDPLTQCKARSDGRAFAFLAGDISVDVDVDVDVDAKGREHRAQAISSVTAIDCPAKAHYPSNRPDGRSLGYMGDAVFGVWALCKEACQAVPSH